MSCGACRFRHVGTNRFRVPLQRGYATSYRFTAERREAFFLQGWWCMIFGRMIRYLPEVLPDTRRVTFRMEISAIR